MVSLGGASKLRLADQGQEEAGVTLTVKVSGSPRRLCAHFWKYNDPTTEGVSVTTSS